MKISKINFIGNIGQKLKTTPKPNLNYEIKNTISFGKKRVSEQDTENIGANYSDMLSMVNTKKTRTIPEIKAAYRRGEDISEDRKSLILSRIPIALKSAEDFTKEHSEFDIEDVEQELIRIVITATDSELNTDSTQQYFGTAFYNLKDRYFSSILRKERIKADPNTERYMAIEMEEMSPEEVHTQLERDELNKELKADFTEAISRLKPQYREIIIKRYGLDGNKPMTLEEIGSESSSTRQNIRQNGMCAMRDFKKAYLNIQLIKKMRGHYED